MWLYEKYIMRINIKPVTHLQMMEMIKYLSNRQFNLEISQKQLTFYMKVKM